MSGTRLIMSSKPELNALSYGKSLISDLLPVIDLMSLANSRIVTSSLLPTLKTSPSALGSLVRSIRALATSFTLPKHRDWLPSP